MELSRLRGAYEHEGPFATVYLEGRPPSEDADHQVRLRWKGLRERLASAGASAAALDAIESRLGANADGEIQANGRVLVATEDEVVLDEAWDAALGAGDDAHWGALPELGAYVREAARSVRELVVITDQQGAQVRYEVIAEQHQASEAAAADTVEGGAVEGVHKPRGGALAHKQMQRRADETVSRNAKDIVEHIQSAEAKFRPRVLVLAGDVQGRTAVRDQLSARLSEILVETGQGARNEGASEEPLTEELLRIAGDELATSAQHHTERLQAGLVHRQAVQGSESVVEAAEMGAVETLLFEHGVPATDEAWLLKACVRTSSAFALVAEGTRMPDGAGALLRFPLND